MSIRVLRPGLLTTVQDLGRPGHQASGVTVGGAMDPFALRIANLLVGNEAGAAGLELTLVGPTLRFDDEALVALCGGDLGAAVDGVPFPSWRPVRVRAGATLEFRGVASGCRAYLAVAGAVAVPAVLGSRSTHLRAGFGGLDGRPLRAGDVLSLGAAAPEAERLLARLEAVEAGAARAAPFAAAPWAVGGAALAGYRVDPVVRLMPGPEFDRLAPESRERLFGEAFRVAPESDRMGYRLDGPRLELTVGDEMISEGVAAGTLQLPPGGAPIALMADRQTTGGYPRIGQIASVDLPVLAQLKPGDAVRFRRITLREAERLFLDRERAIEQVMDAIRLRGREGGPA